MKEKHPPKRTPQRAAKGAIPSGDFKLEDWQGPVRVFRFIGWRDDYSAFFVLDSQDRPLVIEPVLFKPESPIRFHEPPISISKTRLLAPPIRSTRPEAALLCEITQLPDARACASFDDATELYCAEALRLRIAFQPPEPWELVYGDALAPEADFKSAADPQSIEDKLNRAQELNAMQEKLRGEWAARHGLTLKSMEIDRAEFLRRHGGHVFHSDQMAALARVRYKMEFKSLVSVWLTDRHGPGAPQSTADLDQIRKLLDARPELVRLTPEEAEEAIGLTPDSKHRKHRTLQKRCEFAGGLNFEKLTRDDIPKLKMAQDHFDELRRLGGKHGREEQEKKKVAEAAKYGTEYRSEPQ